MNYFQDSVTKMVYAFENDVVATDTSGVYSFATAKGVALTLPTTLQPYTVPAATLAQQQAAQIAVLTLACAAAIVGGFTSSALGAAYTYPSKPTDQSNLAAAVGASLVTGLAAGWTTPLWCADASDAWAFTAHTAAQVQQVNADWMTIRTTAQAKLATLTAQVTAVTTAAAVAAIVWS